MKTAKPRAKAGKSGPRSRSGRGRGPAGLTPIAEGAVGAVLAPGSAILVDSRPVQQAGITCFVVADGDIYLLTCGHVFESGASGTGVFAGGVRVAALTQNFLEEASQLDAACCRLNAKGRKLLDASVDAPTWCTSVLAPAAGEGKKATFWPSNVAANDAITTPVLSSSASQVLKNDFWALSLSGLIQTDGITEPGDSGSLLAVGEQYYASCTGTPSSSYFTPLHATVARMRQVFSEVELWQPGS